MIISFSVDNTKIKKKYKITAQMESYSIKLEFPLLLFSSPIYEAAQTCNKHKQGFSQRRGSNGPEFKNFQLQFQKMGASFTVPRSRSSSTSLKGKAPTIVECHNKAEWTAHYEATKETNKLVNFI